jgi:Protein phosphatase 1 inhibitor
MANNSSNEVESKTEFDINQSVDEIVRDMIKEKQDNPDLIIPYSFLDFYNRPEMLELISSIYEYSKTLTFLNSAFFQLKKQGNLREAKVYSDKKRYLLPELARKIAIKYGRLLFRQKVFIPSLEDQSFFETVIFFAVKVVKLGFNPDQWSILDEELNRLFRSTAFNIVQRKNQEGEKFLKYPQLKSGKKDLDTVISNIMIRNSIQKSRNYSNSVEGIARPAFVKISPFRAISSRSPLISLLLPSPKDKIREFNELRRRLIAKSSKITKINYNLM